MQKLFIFHHLFSVTIEPFRFVHGTIEQERSDVSENVKFNFQDNGSTTDKDQGTNITILFFFLGEGFASISYQLPFSGFEFLFYAMKRHSGTYFLFSYDVNSWRFEGGNDT